MTAIPQALNAYASAAGRLGAAAGASQASFAGSAASGAVSFSDMLQQAAGSSLDQARSAEGLSGKALQGKADLSDVVTAVTNAETTLMTVVSLRDRMVASLQEIMRMPI
jgi:flagellar hook-basal body complex protein FliE